MAGESFRVRALPTARIAAFTALSATVMALVLFPLLPSALHVSAGAIAAQTVRAPRNLTYSSEVVRGQLAEQAVKSVRDVVSYNVTVKSEQVARLTEASGRASTIRETAAHSRSARDEALGRAPGLALTASQRATLLELAPESWRLLVEEATRVLGAILEEPFGAAQLEDRLASVPARVSAGLSATQGDLVVALVKPLVVPTQRVDENETQRAREKAAASVGPQSITYARNQVIVREGEPIDAAKIEALRNAGLLDQQVKPADLVAALLVSLLAAAALGGYLLVTRPPSLASMSRLALVAALVGVVMLAAKLYLPRVTPDSGHHFYAFALPVALAPLLVGVLFEAPFAIVVSGVVALLAAFSAVYYPELSGIVGPSAGQPLQMATAYFFGGLAGVLTVQRAERLNRFFFAGLAVAIASFLSVTAFWSLESMREPQDLLWIAANSLGAGALTALMAVGLCAVLGSVFDVTTRLQLMELAQLNAPLLRRLQEEAPGTFHHSIIVGNLAERAAQRIGADSLLVRVGAYYHDVGKLGQPAFFIENQLGDENPHDRLEPDVSAHLIQEHVRHGSELARRARLPASVRAFIPEHHGTRLVVYFYRTAASTDATVDPERFRYPGPAPQSRETALVMLADSTEAVVRASRERDQATIDALVEAVIAERLAEGQFDACDLTLRDLRLVAESFKFSLRAIYHPRIEYPAAPPRGQAQAIGSAALVSENETISVTRSTTDFSLPADLNAPEESMSAALEPVITAIEATHSDDPAALLVVGEPIAGGEPVNVGRGA